MISLIKSSLSKWQHGFVVIQLMQCIPVISNSADQYFVAAIAGIFAWKEHMFM